MSRKMLSIAVFASFAFLVAGSVEARPLEESAGERGLVPGAVGPGELQPCHDLPEGRLEPPIPTA